jgi:hypothetical protein
VRELAAVARRFDGTLSIHPAAASRPKCWNPSAGRRRVRELQNLGRTALQLFDVLSEQPEGSAWRALYERMVERCNEFAAHGLSALSELAETHRAMGRGSYLGDAARGRVDGNLFLVFWLGNLVEAATCARRWRPAVFKEAG